MINNIYKRSLLISILFFLLINSLSAQQIYYVDTLSNVRHPQIGYWFITPETLVEDAYLKQIEEYAQTTPYKLIFLTARNGVDFWDVQKMHPIFDRLVRKAEQNGIHIGLQIWDTQNKEYTERSCSRTIVEIEGVLNASGQLICRNKAMNIRESKPFKQVLFHAYAFKKCGEGIYEPGTLQDITSLCKQTGSPENFEIVVQAGKELAGYTVYIMSEVFYPCSCLFSGEPEGDFYQLLHAYSDIPFKGVALDEFGYMAVKPSWILDSDKEIFSIRHYSVGMRTAYQDRYNRDLDKDLFVMRYSPKDSDTEKILARNCYMDLMRHGPLRVESAVARYAKSLFGSDIFLGFHNTYHNDFDNDEIWHTGINWWTLPRDYGHSDENIATSIQEGIGMANIQPVMYNMYYHKDMDVFAEKALTDLRYGIRTIYHAINDKGKWGVSVESPQPAALIRQVERMAVLANCFNSTFADTRILVIAGMEALANWYPISTDKGQFDINNSLHFQEKVQTLWKAGYLNALVPSDLIENDMLILNEDNKPMLNGYTFDAVIYLNPQYAKPKTLHFITEYVKNGGNMLIEGIPQKDFYANDISDWWHDISDKIILGYSLEHVKNLGISKNPYKNGNRCKDGSVVMTNYQSLKNDSYENFSVAINNRTYTGQFQGFFAIDVDEAGRIKRFSGKCGEIYNNGRLVFKLEHPAEVLFNRDGNDIKITVVGTEENNKVLYYE